MVKADLKRKIIEITNNLFGLSLEKSDEDEALISLGIDSINFMMIIVHLEEYYDKDIDIDYTITNNFFTLRLSEFVDVVWEYMAGK